MFGTRLHRAHSIYARAYAIEDWYISVEVRTKNILSKCVSSDSIHHGGQRTLTLFCKKG